MKNKETKYTTIQIRKEINEHIKRFCKERGMIAAHYTEQYWIGLISASMSGSVLHTN
jgi:hypothetical protein